MHKKDYNSYKVKKGVGQIVFDVALNVGFKVAKINISAEYLIAYATIKGVAYLLWDIYMFNKEVKGDDNNGK